MSRLNLPSYSPGHARCLQSQHQPTLSLSSLYPHNTRVIPDDKIARLLPLDGHHVLWLRGVREQLVDEHLALRNGTIRKRVYVCRNVQVHAPRRLVQLRELVFTEGVGCGEELWVNLC